jgi:hypothetical protein
VGIGSIKTLVGARIFQPLGERLTDTGTEMVGTWEVLSVWKE